MINITHAIKCKVVNQEDREYKPVPSPIRPTSFMLELCPEGTGYVFQSRHVARSAIHHTIEYRENNGEKYDKSWLEDYIVFNVERR